MESVHVFHSTLSNIVGRNAAWLMLIHGCCEREKISNSYSMSLFTRIYYNMQQVVVVVVVGIVLQNRGEILLRKLFKAETKFNQQQFVMKVVDHGDCFCNTKVDELQGTTDGD